jgi:hypothetical protein
MERSTMRKVIRAASLSLLLATATGVASVEMIGASAVMADADGAGSNPAQGSDPAQPANPANPSNPSNPSNPGGGLLGGAPVVGGLVGGAGGLG